MKDTTLVILAAGIGSRFGQGIKQLTRFGASGELIIDYSIHDALEAGFNKVVFLIRHDLEKDFREMIGDKIAKITRVEYAFQEKEELPAPFVCPETRKKPWGTGHALLACREKVSEPFAVINADDYYGKSAFRIVHEHLVNAVPGAKLDVCMAGFVLKNTLSDFGGVTRGVCEVENGLLKSVTETYNIHKRGGRAFSINDGGETEVDVESVVSMNFFGFTPEIFPVLDGGFKGFLAANISEPSKEYLLPTIVDGLIREGRADVSVLESLDSWFGVTYKEDVPAVREAIKKLYAEGVYPEKLF